MDNQRVKYFKQTYCAEARIGETVVKETTGELLKILDDGSMMIKNDQSGRIDIIPKFLAQFYVKFI